MGRRESDWEAVGEKCTDWAGAGNAAASLGLLTISTLAFAQSETGNREVACFYLDVKGPLWLL